MANPGKKPPQPMLPSGIMGRIFGFLMERLAAGNYRWVLKQLKPRKPKVYLEIGFGTGRLAEWVAKRLKPARLCGVDPSKLMLKTASKRLARFARKIAIDLKLGDDSTLPDGPFDAVVASHSFQFWPDPHTTLHAIRERLSSDGVLVFVMRRHISKHVFEWIPNPITKTDNEISAARVAFAETGFTILVDETLKSGSHGFVLRRA